MSRCGMFTRRGLVDNPLQQFNARMCHCFGHDATQHSQDTSYLLAKNGIHVALRHVQTLSRAKNSTEDHLTKKIDYIQFL